MDEVAMDSSEMPPQDRGGPDNASMLAEGDVLLEEIEKARLDAVLLLNFVSERKEPSYQEGPGARNGCASWTTEELLAILRRTPAEIHARPKDWAVLLAAIDQLADIARPATVESIRFTRAYVDGGGDVRDEAPGKLSRARRVKWLKRMYIVLCALGLLAVFGAMLLLHHVFTGRLILQRLTELASAQTTIHLLTAQAFPEVNPQLPEVNPQPSEGNTERSPCDERSPALSAMQNGVCDRVTDLARKRQLTYLQLEVWNRTADRFFLIPNLVFRPSIDQIMRDEAVLLHRKPDSSRPGGDAMQDLQKLVKQLTSDWDRTELRTEAMLAGMSNYGIPTLLGFIGAVIFVFRRLATHLEEWTLDSRERILVWLRPMLGLIFGGLASLIFEPRSSDVGDLKLSLGLLAFVGGVFGPVHLRPARWGCHASHEGGCRQGRAVPDRSLATVREERARHALTVRMQRALGGIHRGDVRGSLNLFVAGASG